MTKAHNLCRYLKEKYGLTRMDNDEFIIGLFNLSDREFDIAIRDIIPEHEGLLPEWD